MNSMNRLLLGLMLLVTATAARAEWVLVDDGDQIITYVDRSTIRRSGNLVKMWHMMDFKTVQTVEPYNFYSGTYQVEYECKEETSKNLALNVYSGKVGTGKSLYTYAKPGDAIPISPRSIAEALWKIACGKK